MKNVCIVLKKEVSASAGGECAVLDAFYLCGYSFEEIRILPQSDEGKLRAALLSLKESCDNILLLADKAVLPIVKGHLSAIFNGAAQVNVLAAAGVYTEKECSVFLLSADESEMGVDFVNAVCAPYLEKKYGIRYEKTII